MIKFNYTYIVFIIMLPSTILSQNIENNKEKKDYYTPNFSFNHRPYIGGGANRILLGYNATLQIKRIAEIGVGVGFNSNKVNVHSSSIEHSFSTPSIPTYITAILYPYNNGNNAFYIKGNYGLSNNLNSSKNKNDKSLKGVVSQLGIGYRFRFNKNRQRDRSFYIELSNYSSTAKGTYTTKDDYNAIIDYNVKYKGVIFLIGFNIN